MNLRKKKILAAKTLKVGKEKIIFVQTRLDEIKEAITKQDIRDLYESGAIKIKQIIGRKKQIGRKKRKSIGNIRKKIRKRKREYIALTRKLRKQVEETSKIKKISDEQLKIIRKKIKNREFRNKSDIKGYLDNLLKK
jgi:large subunit ribosomal protein L19e